MTGEQVLRAIDELSDSDNFEENDSDRDSIYNPSDNETADLTTYSDSDSDANDAARPKRSGQSQKQQKTTTTDRDSRCANSPHSHVTVLQSVQLSDTNDTQDEVAESIGETWIPLTDTYKPPLLEFTECDGIRLPPDTLSPETLPADFFKLFLTDDIVSTMVRETNRYAGQFMDATTLKPRSRMHDWKETDPCEMKKFLGLVILMGIIQKPSISSYWSTDPVIATPLINKVMSRNRFELLLKFWHFADNTTAEPGDRLGKLKNIVDSLLNRFQSIYYPEKQLSIDEAMVLWRGRLVFRQYIPGKRHKYGVKLYLLCESSGYVINALVYCGKLDPIAGFGHSEAVVFKLMEHYMDVGHELFVDNFYTSVPLAKALLKRKTLLCGTLRRSRKHIPDSVVSAKLKKGEVIRRRNGQIVVLKWYDKRDVLMLTTFHDGKITECNERNRKGEPIHKPNCVLSYNDYMCGVDRCDQLTSYYSPLRKSLKWYRKVVLHFLDIALTNAYLLYKKVGGSKSQLWFRQNVIRSLLMEDSRGELAEADEMQPFYHHKSGDLSRLSGQHYMDLIPSTSRKANPARKCVQCAKHGTRKETRYFCQTCMSQPALCVVPCFQKFHTVIDN